MLGCYGRYATCGTELCYAATDAMRCVVLSYAMLLQAQLVHRGYFRRLPGRIPCPVLHIA
eukprot:1173919-Rhodomonas_salina.1